MKYVLIGAAIYLVVSIVCAVAFACVLIVGARADRHAARLEDDRNGPSNERE